MLTRGNCTAPVTFRVADIEIPIKDNVKVLGVHIDDKLKFDKHISVICKKASRHLNAISRVSKFLDEKCRISLYHSFILSHFNYCNIVWHHCDKENANKVERVQKRALRVVLNDYKSTYEELLMKAGQPLMFISRLKTIALETFKSVNKLNQSLLFTLSTSSVLSCMFYGVS